MHQDSFVRWVENDSHFVSAKSDSLAKQPGLEKSAPGMNASGPGQPQQQQPAQSVRQPGNQQAITTAPATQPVAAGAALPGGSNANAPARVSLDASLRSSAARRPRSTGAPGSQKSGEAPAPGVSVLFDHYLSMIPQQQVAFDKPKGLISKLFVSLLCPPTDLFDVQHLSQGAIHLVVLAAQAVVFFSFIWVPAWLYLVWRTVQSSGVLAAQQHHESAHTWLEVLRAVLPVTLPVVLLAVASERLSLLKETRDKARRSNLVRADSLTASPPPCSIQHKPAAALQPATRSDSVTAAGMAGVPSSNNAPQPTSSTANGTTSRSVPAPGVSTQAASKDSAQLVTGQVATGSASRPPATVSQTPGGISQARSSEGAILVPVPIQEVGKQPAPGQPTIPTASPAASTAPGSSAAGAGAAARAVPAGTTITTTTTTTTRKAAPPSSQPPPGQARPSSEDPCVREVRGLLIQLERVLYGNELTEGLLPLDTLPQRVQKVCEDVGVEADEGQTTSPSGMIGLLQQARSIVGA